MPLSADERARVEREVRTAATEDLLDRVTAYRAGMEADALALIEEELRRRGCDRATIRDHAAEVGDALRQPDGTALCCSFCRRPAVRRGWGLHRLWGVLPVFPRRFNFCWLHAGESASAKRR